MLISALRTSNLTTCSIIEQALSLHLLYTRYQRQNGQNVKLATNLVSAGGEPRISFRQNALHAQKECALHLEFVRLQVAAMLEERLGTGQH